MTVRIALGLIFTYGSAPLALSLALSRLLGRGRKDAASLLGLSFVITPALIGRLVTWLLYATPGGPDRYYVLVVVCAFTLAAAFGARALPELRDLLPSLRGLGASAPVVLGAVGLATAIAVGVMDPRMGPILSAAYATAIGSWSPADHGWAGTMPPIATAALAAFIVASAMAISADHHSTLSRTTLRTRFAELTLGGLVLGSLLLIAALVLGRPLYENDALQYFKVASLIYDDKSLVHYPVMPAAPDGSYFSSAHPLGHYGVLVWTYLVAGGALPGPGKVSVLMDGVAGLMALRMLLRQQSGVVVLTAMLLFLTTPGYTLQLLGCGIDPGRIALFLVMLVVLCWAAQDGDLRHATIAGLVAGLALNSHSETGVLVPFAIIGIISMMSSTSLARRLAIMLTVGCIAFAVGGEQYLINTLRFGSPLQNDHILWQLVPELDYRGWRSGLAPRHDWWGRLSYGPFIGFTNWYFLGVTWWLAAAALILCRSAIFKDSQLRGATLVGFVSLILLACYFEFTAAGELLLNNYRYAMNLQPIVVALAGVLVGTQLSPHAHRA
jgi:hypothetical protein